LLAMESKKRLNLTLTHALLYVFEHITVCLSCNLRGPPHSMNLLIIFYYTGLRQYVVHNFAVNFSIC
jgi:hypothetical protein